MPQGPIATSPFAKNPSNVFVPLNTDSTGNLLVASASGGDAVTLAAGAVVSGAYLSGAIADGAIVTLGTKADAADPTGATGTLIALIKGLLNPLNFVYKTVAASQTAQVLGTTGAVGDYLDSVEIFPAIAACGLVSILDGATTIATFPGGGTTALPTLAPIVIPIHAVCATAWKITTGASVAVVANGRFT